MFLFAHLPRFKHLEKEYICWFEDDEIKIGFSEIPDVDNKIINKSAMTAEEIKKAKKKPLYLKNTVTVYLEDEIDDVIYIFTIPKNYDYDGASIPRVIRELIGSKEDIRFKIASLIHDYMCENHEVINHDRYFSTCVFERLLYVSGTCAFIRWLMKHSVDNYQKFCGWGVQ